MKNFIPGVLFLLFLISCEENVTGKFPAIEVSINDTNKITIEDSVFFIINDSPNKLFFYPNIEGVHLNYSINESSFETTSNLSLTLNETDSVMSFFFSKDGFENSIPRTVALTDNASRFLEGIQLNPIITNEEFNIHFNDKSRGVLTIEFYSQVGQKLFSKKHLKNTELLTIKYPTSQFPIGTFIGIITYGNSNERFRLVKH